LPSEPSDEILYPSDPYGNEDTPDHQRCNGWVPKTFNCGSNYQYRATDDSSASGEVAEALAYADVPFHLLGVPATERKPEAFLFHAFKPTAVALFCQLYYCPN
jgi:hypothetical protein